MALMNGKSKKTLVKKGLGRPVELAVDSQQERLYWIDRKLKVIEYIGLKGTLKYQPMIKEFFLKIKTIRINSQNVCLRVFIFMIISTTLLIGNG